MTVEEAIRHLQTYSTTNGSGQTTQAEHEEAKQTAIKALSQPTEDAISRQDLLDMAITLRDIANPDKEWEVVTVRTIERLKSVTPKQRTGRWEIISGNNSRCSICGVYNPPDYFNRPVIYNYCPFCGAKMEG